MLAVASTMPASRIVMKVAYWLRLAEHIDDEVLAGLAPQQRVIRASRLRRARRNRAADWRNPKVGIDPRRSSQPRCLMKYAALRLRADEVHREVEQEDDADRCCRRQ